jgi:hypothetical protein
LARNFVHYIKTETMKDLPLKHKSTRTSTEKKEKTLFSGIEEQAKKIIAYIEERYRQTDNATLVKYSALALMGVYGIRKSKWMGKLMVPIMISLISDHFEKPKVHRGAKVG